MEKDSDLRPNMHVLSCPFLKGCNLPKNDSCNFPEYKVCPDYQAKLNSLRTKSKILH